MTHADNLDLQTLAEAFDTFTKSTQAMEESYRRLEERIKELDAELAEKNRELAQTSDYLNYILESMSDGVIAVDTQGAMTAFNRAASEILGFRADQVHGRSFQETFGREFAVSPASPVVELRAEDGSTVSVDERDSPMEDRNGQRIGMVKVFQDLTELEALREEVRRMDRLAAVGEMAATVAHEIRNPLGGIRGFATLLARDTPIEDPRSRLINKILEGTANLERVVSELLEYTRPLQLRLRPTYCADLIEAALGYVDLSGREIEIRKDIAPELRVRVDPDKMRQVLLNILLNAVQSIAGKGTICASADTDGAAVTVAIKDTGCGMNEEQTRQAFSPFFTTKEKGTGLGLAVAAKIVEGHNGELNVNSAPGKGSTFLVRLPGAE